MSRSVKLIIGLAAVIAFATTPAAASGTVESSRATIKLASKTPVVVSGRGFRSGERVVVKIYGTAGTFTKTVTASRLGRFMASFARADASCGPLSARAVGSRGSRASFKHIPIPPPCIPIQP